MNPLTPELNPSAQRSLPRFLLGILIFKRLTARRLYKSFGVKRLIIEISGLENENCEITQLLDSVFGPSIK
jgi:hypothetical protein